jgi:LytS/YehU family sensor histidine kinase
MEKEIEYLKNYIALQKLRIEPSTNIIVEDNLEDARCNRTIAPMLLIPFVENAFKHGISVKEKSWITILLSCANEVIHFEVRNSIHHAAISDTEKNNSGIGLKNVRGRLEMLYPGKYRMDITEEQDQFIVKLELR